MQLKDIKPGMLLKTFSPSYIFILSVKELAGFIMLTFLRTTKIEVNFYHKEISEFYFFEEVL